jgi:hypothetical protein
VNQNLELLTTPSHQTKKESNDLNFRDILKIVVANCALDKLKMEISKQFAFCIAISSLLGLTVPKVERVFTLLGSLCKD